ncbi:NADH:flavin oxidoreductase [Bosea sp. (in: a-proteobacteria)]|uniref:NADH:flavin oxidoreductase n=1 Tax=Bosea sp. (in: a-proteobacteria) TaxID=1871050 RepID=UPI002622D3EC|nr:NADH:flavin oxidoreductase [Bosea sp. (in: a-proteobacteria)]MCO5091261.1 NADH:flavin oxidoreductase [Bosea sp. (in: a-proteobacteria)]
MTADVHSRSTISVGSLFAPLDRGPVHLRNRLVMAPMTRRQAPGGVLGEANAAYYRRRAESGVGLIISEGTWIDHPVASDAKDIPRFYGSDALAGWQLVIDEVHRAGGRIFPQIWHTGTRRPVASAGWNPELLPIGPSGLAFVEPGATEPRQVSRPMTQADIDQVIEAFAEAAARAHRIGADGVEIHGAHGYLIDQFLWEKTNHRTDSYGGSPENRVRFATEIVRECRRRTAPDFPIGLRFSQWKAADYDARIAHDPQELARLLEPLADAGVDVFHCSTRRFWEPAFTGSDLSLAGWTKKLTGKITIGVGSVGLDQAHIARPQEQVGGYTTKTVPLDRLVHLMEREEFDLIAVGRSLLVDHKWPEKVRDGAWEDITAYSSQSRNVFY